MHLIEYDLDYNLDENDPDDAGNRLLWETILGRNDFCVNVKLLTWLFNSMKGEIINQTSMTGVMAIAVPILVGGQLEALCSFAYKNNAAIEKEAELQYELQELDSI